MQEDNRARLRQCLLGAAVGFALGLIAGLPLGILGISAPFVGVVFGAILGGTASQRVCRAFLIGYVATGPVAFLIAFLVIRYQMGAVLPDEPSSLFGLLFSPFLIGTGSALIGGWLAAIIAESPASPSWRTRNYSLMASGIPILALGMCLIFFGGETAESWLRSESEYRANRKAAEAERQAEAETRRNRQAQDEARSLPVEAGPFLYPRRHTIQGNSFQVLMATGDTPETVARYYTDTLAAQMIEGHDPYSNAPFWEGDFLYQSKRLHVRIATNLPKTAIRTLRPQTNILLRAVPTRP